MLLSSTACRVGGTGRPELADSWSKSMKQAQARALCMMVLASLRWLRRLATQSALVHQAARQQHAEHALASCTHRLGSKVRRAYSFQVQAWHSMLSVPRCERKQESACDTEC